MRAISLIGSAPGAEAIGHSQSPPSMSCPVRSYEVVAVVKVEPFGLDLTHKYERIAGSRVTRRLIEVARDACDLASGIDAYAHHLFVLVRFLGHA